MLGDGSHMTAEFDVSALIETSEDAIIGKGLDNIIRSWNRGAERIYGYSADEAIGRSVLMLVPENRRSEPDAFIEKILRGERVEHLETVRVRRDGARLDISITVWPARDSSGQIVGAYTIGRDITATKQAERERQVLLQSASDRALVLETANRVALDILASRTGNEALLHIAEAARTLARAQYAAIGVAQRNGQGLAEFVTCGLTTGEEAVIGPRPTGSGILGLLLSRTDPLRIDILSGHPSSVGFPPNHPAMSSFLGVPIRRGDTVLGSLYLTNKEGGGPFTAADEFAVQALGAHAAVAIHNLHLLGRQRALISGLIAAQEEERRAVAYDLHDGLTQYVMASHAHLEAFRRAHDNGNEEKARREMDQGLRYLKEAVLESRRMVNGLRSLALDDLGLAGALETLVAEEKARANWTEAEFIHNISGRRYHKNLETTAYRVVQEALTNVRKHAEAKHVRVAVIAEAAGGDQGACLEMEVRDWGRGFVPEQRADDPAHMGLQSMSERVALLGGQYQLTSALGAGTTVHAVLPLMEAPRRAEGDRSP
ncbi:MAG TPA: PAS domain S-box protein [Chthonomonadaceae bacterium]|nr:PAS domain S-box protein [Chthonomonadaceae bacterium]